MIRPRPPLAITPLVRHFLEERHVHKAAELVYVDEQNRCLREIERHQEADKSYMDEGVQLLV